MYASNLGISFAPRIKTNCFDQSQSGSLKFQPQQIVLHSSKIDHWTLIINILMKRSVCSSIIPSNNCYVCDFISAGLFLLWRLCCYNSSIILQPTPPFRTKATPWSLFNPFACLFQISYGQSFSHPKLTLHKRPFLTLQPREGVKRPSERTLPCCRVIDTDGSSVDPQGHRPDSATSLEPSLKSFNSSSPKTKPQKTHTYTPRHQPPKTG